MQSTLTSKGQATIPKEVREKLGIKPGDTVKFFFERDGSVRILPIVSMSSISGILHKPGRKAVSIEEMDQAIRERAAEKYKPATGATKSPRRKA